MPDNWIFFVIILAVLVCLIIGFMLGLWFSHSDQKKGKSKRKEEIEGYFKKILEKISGLEDKLQAKQPVNSAYDADAPTKSNLKIINDRLRNILNKIGENPPIKPPESETKTGDVPVPVDLNPSEDVVEDNLSSLNPPARETSNSAAKKETRNVSFPSQIATLYNLAITNRGDRDLFWEKFSITRIENANAVAQRKGEASVPDFREAGNGDFLAITDDNYCYYVVPLFDTTVTPSAFNEGGIGYAFECHNYDPQAARSITKIKKAAVFQRDGDQWSLTAGGKGELVL